MYIYGGGFTYGGSSDYGGDYLMDEDIVLVTINYRLGALGILSHSHINAKESTINLIMLRLSKQS